MDGVYVTNDDQSNADTSTYWDDDAFVHRVRRAARLIGVSLKDITDTAGVSDAWLRNPARGAGRGIDYILRVAAALRVRGWPGDAADLMGLREPLERQQGRSSRLKRLAVAAGLSAHLYVALDRQDSIDDGDIEAALTAVRSVIDPQEDEAA